MGCVTVGEWSVGWRIKFLVYIVCMCVCVCVCMCVCVFVHAHACTYLWKAESFVRSYEAGISVDLEPPSVGAGNFHCVLCQGSKHC